jgi:hypothetical protein
VLRFTVTSVAIIGGLMGVVFPGREGERIPDRFHPAALSVGARLLGSSFGFWLPSRRFPPALHC